MSSNNSLTNNLNQKNTMSIQTVCRQCSKTFKPSHGPRDKFCSQRCYGDFKKISSLGILNSFFRRTHIKRVRENISEAQKGKHYSIKTEFKKGMKPWNYKEDRDLLKRKDERNDPAYINFVKQVKKRDKECKLKDEDCYGDKVVHHILSWRDFVELRYTINNGITLCQFHHPRKRVDEQRLIPTFNKLVGSNIK